MSEIKHLKQQKYELRTKMSKLEKENITLKQQNREYENKGFPLTKDSSIDKLMAQEPSIAHELKSVANLQKQVLMLQKSNKMLRGQRQIGHKENTEKLEEKNKVIQ